MRRLRLPGAVALAAALAVPLAPGALAAPGVPPAPSAAAAPAASPAAASDDALLDAMERGLGLTAPQVLQRWAAEDAARAVQARLRPAASWYDAGSGRLVVPVTSEAEASRARSAGALPARVRFGPAELARVAAAMPRAEGVRAYGPDPVRDRVVVVLASGAPASAEQDLRALSPAVEVLRSTVTYRQQGGDVVGGESWKPGSESQCSVGFSATGAGGARHFLTAGHCTNDVDQPAYGKDGTRLGTSNTGGTHSVNAREGDFGLVDVTEAGWALAGRVSGYGAGDYTVTGAVDPTVGMSVCHSGANTRLQCGTVTKVNQTVDYGSVVIDGLFETNACSGGGDSGGSYVTGPKADAKAVGVHSGGGNGCGQSGPTTIGQPVVEALAKWNLTLTTGTPPAPGGVTVANPGNRSTPVGTPVSLPASVSGGTAPYGWTATGLPAGLTVDAATGTVTGSPTTPGSSEVTLSAKDAAGRVGSAAFTWTVTAGGTGPLALANPGAQTAYTGRPYRLAPTATGGTTPYTWTAVNLPPGLSLDRATGVISGTPTAWGMTTSTLTVTDAARRTASVSYSTTVWSPW